nr:uncharacterized protein LOC131752222 [Kogia breviceps]
MDPPRSGLSRLAALGPVQESPPPHNLPRLPQFALSPAGRFEWPDTPTEVRDHGRCAGDGKGQRAGQRRTCAGEESCAEPSPPPPPDPSLRGAPCQEGPAARPSPGPAGQGELSTATSPARGQRKRTRRKGGLTEDPAMALDFLAGCAGGVAGVLVGHPFDTVKMSVSLTPERALVRLQVQSMEKPQYRGTLHCFQAIIKQESVSGLGPVGVWRGTSLWDAAAPRP